MQRHLTYTKVVICGPEKQKGVSVILYMRQYIIFLRPLCDLLLFNSSSGYTASADGELEILRKIMYYLKYV
jgi:hypothetical protein